MRFLRLSLIAAVAFLGCRGGATSVQAASSDGEAIVGGAHRVTMLSYPLGKGCDSSATVRKMTLVYESSQPAIGIRTVYASMKGVRLSSKKTIDPRSSAVTLSFPRSDKMGACSGNSVDIFADFSRNVVSGSKHRLYVELASDVFTDEGSVGVPMQGPWIEVR